MANFLPTQVRELDPNERQIIERSLLDMKSLLTDVCGKPTDITPEALDHGYSVWLATRNPSVDPSNTILFFGVAFCQCIADRSGMTWKIVTTADGIQPAIHKTEGNVFMYPISIVGKRYASGETNFFSPLFPVLCQQVERLSKSEP